MRNPWPLVFLPFVRLVAHSVIARSEATKQSSLSSWPLDCFASLAMTGLAWSFNNSPFRQIERLAQDSDIADVVGEDQHQRRIERRTLFVVEPAMRFHHQAEGIVRI